MKEGRKEGAQSHAEGRREKVTNEHQGRMDGRTEGRKARKEERKISSFDKRQGRGDYKANLTKTPGLRPSSKSDLLLGHGCEPVLPCKRLYMLYDSC